MDLVWAIEQLQCYPKFDDLNTVVALVGFRVKTVDGVFTAEWADTIPIAYTAKDPFTPYADLTEDQLVNWVRAALSDDQMADIEEKLCDSLLRQQRLIVTPLPWA